MRTAIVRYTPAHGTALFRLRGLLLALQAQVHELEREYAASVERLREFEKRFRPAVGRRFDELERLREKIERAWEAVAESASGRQSAKKEPPKSEASDRVGTWRPADGARALFLKLARRIHPDLVMDGEERRRRHEIMAEATLAYRDGNERRLQWLLEHWEAQSGPISGFGQDAVWVRTNRQIAWARYRIRELQHATGQLHASPAARLMHEHEQARLAGRNLILEMRRQVLADIEDARRELERVRGVIDDMEPAEQAAIRSACGL